MGKEFHFNSQVTGALSFEINLGKEEEQEEERCPI